MNLRFRLISFDLDGTLVDTAAEIAEAANDALVDAGLPQRGIGEVAALVGGGTRDLMTRLLAQAAGIPPKEVAPPRIEAALDDFKRHYARIAGSSARPYEGCAGAMKALRDRGVHLACITNKDEGFAATILRTTGLAGFFELLIGGDTLPHMKPHAGVIRHAIDHFGLDAQSTAHVGDSRTDVLAARNAGVAAWGVPWGYNAGEAIEAAMPDRVFVSLPELADHVLRCHANPA
jgi:phosphoglycolate phosphatase